MVFSFFFENIKIKNKIDKKNQTTKKKKWDFMHKDFDLFILRMGIRMA